MLCPVGSVSRAQDTANGEKGYKAKCAGCRGADAAGKPAMKSPSIKGKTADEIQKEISTSPKHAGMKSLTADEVKDIAAYCAGSGAPSWLTAHLNYRNFVAFALHARAERILRLMVVSARRVHSLNVQATNH